MGESLASGPDVRACRRGEGNPLQVRGLEKNLEQLTREGHALGLVTQGEQLVGVGPSCESDPDNRPGGLCILGPDSGLLLGLGLEPNNDKKNQK